jgi:hypothetical protein
MENETPAACAINTAVSVRVKAAAWGVLLLSLACLIAHIAHLPEQQARLDWFQGDSLFPAHLMQNVLVEGGNYATWKSPPAPFVFPDWPIVGLVVYATGRPVVANLAFLCINYLVLVLAAVGCNRLVGGRLVEHREVWLLLSLSSLVVMTVWQVSYTLNFLFLPAFHAGTCAWAMVAVYLFMLIQERGRQQKSSWAWLVSLAAICFLLGLSDLLTILYLSAPLTAAVIVSKYFSGGEWKRQLAPLGAVWLATIVGAKTTDWFVLRANPDDLSTITFNSLYLNVTIFCKNASLYLVRGEFTHVAGFLLTLIGIGGLIYLMWSGRQPAASEARRRQILFVGYGAFSVWSIICGIVLGGSSTLWVANDYYFCAHYWLTATYMPFIVLPFCMDWLVTSRSPTWVNRLTLTTTGGLALGVACLLLACLRTPAEYDVWNYQPSIVTQMDAIAEEHDLHAGFVDYWEAREIGLFSKTHVRALPILADSLGYFYWMTNKEWTETSSAVSSEKEGIEFVLTGGLRGSKVSRDTVIKIFGVPTAEVVLRDSFAAEPRSVMIYKTASGESGIEVAMEGFTPALARPGIPVEIPMDSFSSHVGVTKGERKIADEARDAAGYLMFGPWIPLQSGRYALSADCGVSIPKPDSQTHWDVGFTDPAAKQFVVFGGGPIHAGSDAIAGDFVVPREHSGAHVEIRVFFDGSGRLSVEDVRLQRLADDGLLAEQPEARLQELR